MARLQTTMAQRLQRRVNEYLPETCTITRVDEVQGRLGLDEVEVVSATGVACRVIDDNRSQNQGYVTTGAHEANVDAYRVILPAGTTVDVAYRVTVGSRIYDVIELLDDRSNELMIECRVRRVR